MIIKKYISYESIKENLLSKDFSLDYDIILCIPRGGLTISHILSKKMIKQVDFVVYNNGKYEIPSKQSYEGKTILIVEDLIATGRTLKIVKDFLQDLNVKDYTYFAYLIDEKYAEQGDMSKVDFCEVSKDWIVFPWEEEDKVKVGDRGLFRDKTDQYG